LDWIIENGATIGVAAVLSVIVGLIIFKMVRDKKRGKGGCGCGCGGCAMADICHGKSKNNEK
jgi:hypothetical protein